MLGHKLAKQFLSLLDLNLNDALMIIYLARFHLSVVARNDEEHCKDYVEQAINDIGLQKHCFVGDIVVVLNDESEEHD